MLGIKPHEADALEVWQVAALLGVGDEDEDDQTGGPEGVEAGGVRWARMSQASRADRLEQIRRRMTEQSG